MSKKAVGQIKLQPLPAQQSAPPGSLGAQGVNIMGFCEFMPKRRTSPLDLPW